MRTVVAFLWLSVAMLFALPFSIGITNASLMPNVPGWKYEAVYRVGDGAIVAIVAGPAETLPVSIPKEGEAVLDITGSPELSGMLRDGQKGSLDRWYVDTTTLEVKQKAPGPLPVTLATPSINFLVLAVGGASVGLFGIAMLRRRSSS